MSLTMLPMSQQDAVEISNWHYQGSYAFYNLEADEEDLQEFMSPKARGNRYYSVYQGKSLIGFFSFTPDSGRSQLEIALGMKPDLTGQGRGFEFLDAGIQFAQQHYPNMRITLAVATFNKRAIKVYEKAGFQRTKTFLQKTNGGEYEFLAMELM